MMNEKMLYTSTGGFRESDVIAWVNQTELPEDETEVSVHLRGIDLPFRLYGEEADRFILYMRQNARVWLDGDGPPTPLRQKDPWSDEDKEKFRQAIEKQWGSGDLTQAMRDGHG